MKIEVNPYCIMVGKRCDEQYCPVALAIQYHVPDVEDISVSNNNVSLKIRGKKRKYVDLSRSARRFIENFDACREVSPLSFNFAL